MRHLATSILQRLASGEVTGEERTEAFLHLKLCPACTQILRELVANSLAHGMVAGRGDIPPPASGLVGALFRRAADMLGQRPTSPSLDSSAEAIERIALEFIPVDNEFVPLTLAAAPALAPEQVAPARQSVDGEIVIRFRVDPHGGRPQGVVIAALSHIGEGAALVLPEHGLAFPVEPDGTFMVGDDLSILVTVCGEYWRFPKH